MSNKLDHYFDDHAPSSRAMIMRGLKQALYNSASRTFTHVQNKPLATLFLLSGAVMASIIITNATSHQKQQHPAPLFIMKTTQSKNEQSAPVQMPAHAPVPKPVPKMRGQDAKPPMLQIQRAHADMNAVELQMDQTAVKTGVQQELAHLGFYRGKIDGKWGKQAEAALRAYEILSGIPETGSPSRRILTTLQGGRSDDLTTASIGTDNVQGQYVQPEAYSSESQNSIAMPKPRYSATQPMSFSGPEVQSAPVETHSVQPVMQAQPQQPRRVFETAKQVPQNESAIPELANPWGSSLTLAVEQRLSELGFQVGKVDGKSTTATQRAIEAFERQHDMPISGRINGRLLQEMTAVSGVPLL